VRRAVAILAVLLLLLAAGATYAWQRLYVEANLEEVRLDRQTSPSASTSLVPPLERDWQAAVAVLAVVAGSTRATMAFFTNFGVAYTSRITDVPASTGYGEPIQSLFKFKDGEKVVGALSLDPRSIGNIKSASPDTPANNRAGTESPLRSTVSRR